MKQLFFFLFLTTFTCVQYSSITFAQKQKDDKHKDAKSKASKTVEAQKDVFKYGFSLLFGYAKVNNKGSIKIYYDQIKTDNLEKTYRARQGTLYGFSALASYILNNRFQLKGEIQYLSQQNTIELYEKKSFSDGSYNKISSTATISIYSLQFPLTLKIRFLVGEYDPFDDAIHPFIRFGFAYEARIHKSLAFNENIFNYGGINDTSYRNSFSKAKLDGYKNSGFNFLIGGGVDFVLVEYDKIHLILEINYSSNFAKESLWVNDLMSGKNAGTENSKVFDRSQQENISSKYNVNFNDWKSSNLRLSIGLIF